jgi:hypothetical protein
MKLLSVLLIVFINGYIFEEDIRDFLFITRNIYVNDIRNGSKISIMMSLITDVKIALFSFLLFLHFSLG